VVPGAFSHRRARICAGDFGSESSTFSAKPFLVLDGPPRRIAPVFLFSLEASVPMCASPAVAQMPHRFRACARPVFRDELEPLQCFVVGKSQFPAAHSSNEAAVFLEDSPQS